MTVVYFLMKVLQVLENVAILCFNITGNKYSYFAFTAKLMQLLFTHAHTSSSSPLKQDVLSCVKNR